MKEFKMELDDAGRTVKVVDDGMGENKYYVEFGSEFNDEPTYYYYIPKNNLKKLAKLIELLD